jgi:hypothetical protein
MRKKNGIENAVAQVHDGLIEVPIEKKTRERKDKHPGQTAVYIDTAIYANLAIGPRAQVSEMEIEIPVNKIEAFVVKKVSEKVTAAVTEKYPECKGGD